VPNNAALVVAGDVDPASVFAQAARQFGSWKRREDPFARRPIPPIPPLERDTIVAVVEGDDGDVTVMLRWQGPSVGEDPAGTYAADVFSALVNQPHSGMQKRLVESGLFRSVSVSYYTLDKVGPITITARAAPERVGPALQALRSEIARFDDPDYFTPEELKIAKKRVEVDAAFDLEAGSSLAYTIGFWWSVAGLDYYRGYVDGIIAQDEDDLRAYVTRYMLGKPKVMGLLLSEATRAKYGEEISKGLSAWFW
jgi:zinc protease